jgi:hypothetical protein
MKTEFIFPNQPLVETVRPPMVYVKKELAWEYKHLSRQLAEEALLSEAQLNVLGGEGWELAGVFADSTTAHYYFKRMREKP